jgi:hypothetical protein
MTVLVLYDEQEEKAANELWGRGLTEWFPAFNKFCISRKNQEDLVRFLEKGSQDSGLNIEGVKARTVLLEQGVPVNEASLAQCVSEKNLPAVCLFLTAGFSADTRDKTGVPLLNLSARAGDIELVRLLLKAGAQVNCKAEDRGSSALIDATMGKYQDIVEELLKAGADPNVKTKDGQSALVLAVGLNDEACVALLLHAGANPDDPDSLGISARRYATLFNKSGMVALFNAIPADGSGMLEKAG